MNLDNGRAGEIEKKCATGGSTRISPTAMKFRAVISGRPSATPMGHAPFLRVDKGAGIEDVKRIELKLEFTLCVTNLAFPAPFLKTSNAKCAKGAGTGV